jgi:DNA gyrase subunit A
MKSIEKYDPKHNLVFIFANGKGVKIPVSAYETQKNRRKLVGAYSDSSPIVAAFYEGAHFDILIKGGGKAIMINTKLIPVKATRTSQGVALMKLKDGVSVESAVKIEGETVKELSRYKKTAIPAAGVGMAEQMKIG